MTKAKTNVIYLDDYRMAKACQEAGKRLDDQDILYCIDDVPKRHDKRIRLVRSIKQKGETE